MKLDIRDARPEEAGRLTAIAQASKAHWGYPGEWLDLWRDELTVSPDYVVENLVLVAESDGRVAGYCSVTGDGPERELDALFIAPEAIRHGLGRRLVDAAAARVRGDGVTALEIASDPQAEAFYLKLGAVRIGEVPSRPEGRTLPLLRLDL